MFQRLTHWPLHPVQLNWMAALFFTTIGNWVLWQTLWSQIKITGLRDLLFLLSLPIFLFCFLNLLLAPIMALPYLRKPLLVLLITISASCTYFMQQYKVLIDRSMVQNFFETNQAEFSAYLSAPLLLTLLVLGVFPALILLLPTLKKSQPLATGAVWWLGHILVSLAVLVAVSGLFYKDYASLVRNNLYIKDQLLPFNFLRNTHGYFKRKASEKTQALRAVASDAVRTTAPNQRPKLLIVVLGETARAQNFQLNGYDRPTTPRLSQRKDVISFQNVSSCGTATAISLPCMFSRLPRTQYDEVLAATEENLLDILQRTGLEILWRNNNNGGCKKQCDRVPTEDMPKLKSPDHCTNSDGTCNDEVLLQGLQARIDQMPGDALVVLHQIGSHGPTYFERYPRNAAVFTPNCNTNQIQKCSQTELVNTYDNTLLYTDGMLSKTIDLLQDYSAQRDVAMVYISDHGESLGERGMYLHGTPYMLAPKEQTHVPWLVWLSAEFADSAQINLSCLQSHAANRTYSHDNFYHSILGLFGVRSSVYQPELDVFSPCRESIAAFNQPL